MSPPVVTSQRVGDVLVLRLCNPATRNSLTAELRRQFGDAIRAAEDDPAVRAVVVGAEGPVFCSGGDLKSLQHQSDPWSVHRRFRQLRHWLAPLLHLDKPVVVAARGGAIGGGIGLVLAADVVILGQSAELIPGFFRLGVVPDISVMYQLPRLIGMAQAKRFLFGGVAMPAARALDLGLATQVVEDEDVDAVALHEAQRLAAGPAEVMGFAKTLLARSFETGLDDMLAFEGLGQVLAMSSAEYREGLAALLERRSPDFSGAAGRAARS